MNFLKFIPFVISGVLAVSGCGRQSPYERAVLSVNETVLSSDNSSSSLTGNNTNSNLVERRYRVFLPGNYDSDTPSPVILSYHGSNHQIENQVALDELTTPFFNEDYIVVYLQGDADDADRPTHTTWEGAPTNESDDFGFTAEVLNALERKLCIDPARIYATGKSQGGGFVGRLACHPTLSKRIAAFAPVSGAYYIVQLDSKAQCKAPAEVEIPCEPGRSDIPIMAFHGGADTTIKYRGEFQTYCLPDVRHWALDWVARNGLEASSEENTTISGSVNGVVSSWGDGLVKLVYDGDDIKHDWPSLLVNSDNKGGPTAAFNASGWIMDFFGQHSLPANE